MFIFNSSGKRSSCDVFAVGGPVKIFFCMADGAKLLDFGRDVHRELLPMKNIDSPLTIYHSIISAENSLSYFFLQMYHCGSISITWLFSALIVLSKGMSRMAYIVAFRILGGIELEVRNASYFVDHAGGSVFLAANYYERAG